MKIEKKNDLKFLYNRDLAGRTRGMATNYGRVTNTNCYAQSDIVDLRAIKPHRESFIR